MKKELSMRTVLINSISYEAFMLSNGHADEKSMRKHPDFLANMTNYQHNRYVQILRTANQDAGPRDPIYTG